VMGTYSVTGRPRLKSLARRSDSRSSVRTPVLYDGCERKEACFVSHKCWNRSNRPFFFILRRSLRLALSRALCPFLFLLCFPTHIFPSNRNS
jgi:hypothetical protein